MFSVKLKLICEKLRFGRTTRQFTKQKEVSKKDIRVDESAYIAFVMEKPVKKATKDETVWLCAISVVEMYEIIKISLAAIKHFRNSEQYL